MADLVELDVVVRDKGLKQSISTVSRLERELIKAAKAVDENRISQERYNKILLSAKREYQALGVSSQKATAAVRKFADANRLAQKNTNQQTDAISRQNTALTRNAVAVNQSRRGTNQLGVLMQQTGYQVGDFAVQVQSGTNVMVALGQQATQLVGTFGMLSRSTAAIGIFAALGIAVPILTAISGALMRVQDETEKTKFDFQAFAADVQASLGPIAPVLSAIKDATSAVGNAFSSLGNLAVRNMDTIIVAVTALSGLMLAKLVPSIIAATRAMVGFTAATLKNPLVIGATAIATSVALIYELSKSLGSVGKALELLGMAFVEVFKFDSLYYGLRSLNARVMETLLELVSSIGTIGVKILEVLLEPFNQIGAVAMGVFEGIKSIWGQLPSLFRNVGAKAANFFIDGMEALATGATKALNKVVSGLNNILEFVGAKKAAELFGFSGVISELDAPDLSQWKAEVLEDGQDVGKAFSDGFNRGYDSSVASKPVLDTINALVSQADSAAIAMGSIADAFGEAFIKANPKIEEIIKRIQSGQSEVEELADYFKEVEDAADGAGSAGSKAGKDIEKAMKTAQDVFDDAFVTAQEFEIQLAEGLVSGIQSVGQAWADFVMGGFQNFEGFVDAVWSAFKNLIAQMIATAASNQIMIGLGLSGGGGGGLLGGGGGGGGGLLSNLTGGGGGLLGTIGGGIASVGSSLVTGGSAVAGGFLQGLGGVVGQGIGGLGASFGSLGGILSGSVGIGGGSMAAAIGAAVPAVGAIFAGVSLIAGLFKKKTTLIDQGLDIAIDETGAFVETFRTIREKSFFKGSSYSRFTAPASAEIADPIVETINGIQSSIMEAASTLGIASSTFDNFTYNFSLSLKGLSEEEQMQKINEELSKMGDSFASLTGYFETMNELVEAANQRYQLQTRLLQLQGNEEELLRRQREQETAAVHDLNRATLQRVYALEDARMAMDKGLQSVQAALQAQQQSIQNSANAEIERLQDQAALQIKTIENDAEDRANAIGETVSGVLEAAQEALGRSSDIYDMLSGALRNRLTSERSDQQFSALRRQAFGFLSSISDVSGVDVDRLEDALGVLSEPSEQLFSNFVDYARDFNRTTGIISNLTDTAETQLSADEQAVNLLEEQLEQQRSIRDSSRDQIREIQEGVRNQINTIRDRARDQIAVLQSQYDMAVSQYNAALGIDDSVKSVGEAIKSLTDAIEMLNSANAPASSGNTIGQKILGEVGQSGESVDSSGKIYKSVNATTQSKLLEAAKLAGIETSGKTGIQIAQEIANVAGVGLKITESLSQKQFAQGGFHTGGMRIVGERGPELEMTGPSRIYSNRQTSEMFRDPELANEVRGLRGEVAGLRAENAQLQANNNKYTKRSYDLYRKWDVEGIPAERA